MRNTKLFPFLAMALFFPLFTSGQSNIHVIAKADNNRISLRWTPSSYEVWQTGNNQGYSILRYKTHEGDTVLSPLAMAGTETLVADSLAPLAENDWESWFPGNNFAQVAKGALYSADTTTVLTAAAKLADAVNAEQSREVRFVFALFAAEQDFEVAKAMALGFEDTTVEAGAVYLYRIAVQSPSEIQGILSVKAETASQPPAPGQLSAEGLDHTALVQWYIKDLSTHYSAYDIERSSAGQPFAKVNEYPFVFASDSEEDPEYAMYKDSLADNETTYQYRIRGRTPFGTLGPPSDTILVKGMPPRLNLFLAFSSQEVTANGAELRWDSLEVNDPDALSGFNVYRSVNARDYFELLNTGGLLDPADRSYTDPAPLPAAYYKLEAVDTNGYVYQSPAALVQMADSIPPDPPTGLDGRFITAARVQLDWNANSEADLKGYRVFVANQRDAHYTQATAKSVFGEAYIYEIDPTFMADSIFFKLMACDDRDNQSDLSTAFALPRPDVLPPAKPVLHKANPTPEGIELGFRFSSSEDRLRHELQRKRKGAPGWETLVAITREEEGNYLENLTPNSVTVTSYIDTAILERREYEYRLLAYDADDNDSSSELLTVRPYDSGRRGEIDHFEAQVVCVPLAVLPNQAAYDILERILDEYEAAGTVSLDSVELLVYHNVITAAEYNDLTAQPAKEIYAFLTARKLEFWKDDIVARVELGWDYEAQEQLQDFQLFRSAEGSAVMLYKTIPLSQLTAGFLWVDEDVKPGRRYFYQMMARHTDGGFSERSGVLMVWVPR